MLNNLVGKHPQHCYWPSLEGSLERDPCEALLPLRLAAAALRSLPVDDLREAGRDACGVTFNRPNLSRTLPKQFNDKKSIFWKSATSSENVIELFYNYFFRATCHSSRKRINLFLLQTLYSAKTVPTVRMIPGSWKVGTGSNALFAYSDFIALKILRSCLCRIDLPHNA